MPHHVTFESTIKGGLPVIADVSINPPEPDVGLSQHYGELEGLYFLSGHACSFDITKQDHDRLIEEAFDHD